ncbi:MAG: hypothetical protein UHU19_11180 [Lachnospiraceae bacterium]|nr:hypothetical protein [Lachnospiraceae bacterium]
MTSYGKDIECFITHKRDEMIPIFQKLSEQIRSNRVIRCYDPILFTKWYTT